MASAKSVRYIGRSLSCLKYRPTVRTLSAGPLLSDRHGSSSNGGRWAVAGVIAGIGGVCLAATKYRKSRDSAGLSFIPTVHAEDGADKGKGAEGEERPKTSKRELRYKDFASLMYGNEVYMTPRDFLESVTQDQPRSHGYMFTDDKKLATILKATPPLNKGSHTMLRDMWNDGVFSYADYLFLLTALIKPRRQFEIVFRMIDVDRSDTVDLNEFTTVINQNKLEQSSLTAHLFGARGNRKLSSKDFFKFIDDLQTEVRQMEFNQYSMGAPTISAEQFARILLRHTGYDVQEVVDRLGKEPSSPTDGITFDQFNDFCQLLNALDDFAVAMTMYTIAGKSVSEEEFGRASQVCIGKPLDSHLVHAVFKIFDRDGDGKLSYKEFLSVMKNWKLRGMKLRETKRLGMKEEFKACLEIEMRNQ